MGHGTCINELDALELEEVRRAAERARVCTQRNSVSLVVHFDFCKTQGTTDEMAKYHIAKSC